MKKILYAGNNQNEAESVKLILNEVGFETECVFSGRECIKKAKKFFDLTLLDLTLPDMSIWEIFTKLKEKTNSKFVFLSPIPISSERLDALKKEGISDYILKPFAKNKLIARIDKLSNKRQL